LWFKANQHLNLEGYCDADWAICRDDSRDGSGSGSVRVFAGFGFSGFGFGVGFSPTVFRFGFGLGFGFWFLVSTRGYPMDIRNKSFGIKTHIL
jgi:hypothetical protein